MKKTVLITGASSGFGRLSAKKFQQEGWNVVATMRSPKKETELNQLDNVLVTQLDVTDSVTIKTAAVKAIEQFGAIDVLVNNAGFATRGFIDEASIKEVNSQFEVNVLGVTRTTQEVTPHMRACQSGMIINVTSIAGFVGVHLNSLYAASKFAVQGLSESLAYDMALFGIKVKVVVSGSFNTGFNEAIMWSDGAKPSNTPAYRDTYLSHMESLRTKLQSQGATKADLKKWPIKFMNVLPKRHL